MPTSKPQSPPKETRDHPDLRDALDILLDWLLDLAHEHDDLMVRFETQTKQLRTRVHNLESRFETARKDGWR